MELSDSMVPILLAPAYHYVFRRKGKTSAEGDLVTKRRTDSNTPLLAMPSSLTLCGDRVLQEQDHGLPSDKEPRSNSSSFCTGYMSLGQLSNFSVCEME